MPDMIVLHYTAMDSTAAALERLCDPVYEVSAHYLISETGQVYGLVDEAQRAWHAGAGSWGDVHDVNSRSIGIELANDGQSPFAADQMDALEALLADIIQRWDIPPARIIGHRDMAPERKIDPGPKFDWARLARRGLALRAPQNMRVAVDEIAFMRALTCLGYPIAAPEARLGAFRDRYRPGAQGALDGTDCAMAAALAARYPVDARAENA